MCYCQLRWGLHNLGPGGSQNSPTQPRLLLSLLKLIHIAGTVKSIFGSDEGPIASLKRSYLVNAVKKNT